MRVTTGLLAQDNPDGVDDAGNITAERQQDIEPEVQAKADLKKDADRRQENGKNYTNYVHD
jgi:hypothetical protein